MPSSFLNQLNEAQKKAVINFNGPSLVIAGAGAGKTRVLTYRIAWLLEQGIEASRILALTFTNKAAGEMKERITDLAGYNNARYLWMGTFHSIFARILRAESAKLGYPSSYTIYDATDSKSLVRTIIREMNLDDKLYKPSSVAGRISSAKNNLVTASAYMSNKSFIDRDTRNRVPEIANIYKRYQARCFKSGAMDFDDLLLNTNILFRDFPDVLQKYRDRFSYVLVDEYQDTNWSQYRIVKQLSEQHRNLCVVGDDAQSIYSFRGARIENILNFEKDYPDYQLFKLEQNYRSTQNIVNAANSVIRKNRDQIRKTIFSKNAEGNRIRVFKSMTDAEEGFRIASDIFDKSLSEQLKWEEFAVLYRTNAQSRIFEEAFRKRNIPYKIYGGLSFYERKEIKDILAYFRMIINPADEEALKRTINYPKRGIGKTSLERIFEAAEKSDVTPWAVISGRDRFEPLFTPATWKRVEVYVTLVNSLIKKTGSVNAFEAAKIIIADTGIGVDLRQGDTPEEISRYENMQELLNAIKEFTEYAETNGEPSDLGPYLQSVALITDQDNEGEEDRNKVTLMTVHSAKGLEFRCVYVTGLEENLFPSLMSIPNEKDIEEERRLFYVALTRAKEQATLSYCLNRYKWGNMESSDPSRFLRELDDKFLDFRGNGYFSRKTPTSFSRDPKPSGSYYGGRSTSTMPSRTTGQPADTRPHTSRHNFKKVSSSQKGIIRSDDNTLADLNLIKPGVRVSHDRFGTGEVISLEGDAPNTTAVVRFNKAGEKKLLLRFARLKILR